jgi:uncharacterized membrane protein YqjE
MEGNGETTRPELRTREWVMPEQDQRSLGELLSELTTDLSTLLRQEIELARVETMEKVSQALRSVISMVAGGLIAYTGVIGLVIAAIVGLAELMPLWLAALIVGALLVIVGVVLIQSGRSTLSQMSVVPEKTVESIREDAEMVKEKVTS